MLQIMQLSHGKGMELNLKYENKEGMVNHLLKIFK